MEKKFRDLKKGDLVFIIDHGEVVEAKVKDTRENYYYGQFYVYTTLSEQPYCGYPGSRKSGNMFVNEEDACEQLRKMSELRKKTLEKKIDKLVSEYDRLDSISPPTVFPPTKPLSMKELKPGDSVWYVDKAEFEVKEAKVKVIRKNKDPWCYGSLIIDTSVFPFSTHPNSTRSISLVYYTGEEQAWEYMLDWRKSRMITVGKEMEKSMKELEKYEKIW